MADRASQIVTSIGVAPTAYAASAGGDTVPPDTIVRVINGGASAITVTVVTPGVVDTDLAIADRTVSVPAGAARLLRPTRVPYANPATGKVDLTWSDTTSVTFEVIK